MTENKKNQFYSWVGVLLRIIVGIIFIASGFLKLMQPWQEFYAVAKLYGVLPDMLLEPFVRVLPWVEVLSGFFFILGWYCRWSGVIILFMLLSFIIAIIFVIVRGVHLDDCGCFGGTFLAILGTTPWQVLVRDILLSAAVLFVTLRNDMFLSFDAYFKKKQ